MVEAYVIAVPVVLGSLAVAGLAILLYCCLCGRLSRRYRASPASSSSSRTNFRSIFNFKNKHHPPTGSQPLEHETISGTLSKQHVVIAGANGRVATVPTTSAIMKGQADGGFANWGRFDDDVDDLESSYSQRFQAADSQFQANWAAFNRQHSIPYEDQSPQILPAGAWEASTLPRNRVGLPTQQSQPILTTLASSPDLLHSRYFEYNPYYFYPSNNTRHQHYNSDGQANISVNTTQTQVASKSPLAVDSVKKIGDDELNLEMQRTASSLSLTSDSDEDAEQSVASSYGAYNLKTGAAVSTLASPTKKQSPPPADGVVVKSSQSKVDLKKSVPPEPNLDDWGNSPTPVAQPVNFSQQQQVNSAKHYSPMSNTDLGLDLASANPSPSPVSFSMDLNSSSVSSKPHESIDFGEEFAVPLRGYQEEALQYAEEEADWVPSSSPHLSNNNPTNGDGVFEQSLTTSSFGTNPFLKFETKNTSSESRQLDSLSSVATSTASQSLNNEVSRITNPHNLDHNDDTDVASTIEHDDDDDEDRKKLDDDDEDTIII